MAGMLASAVLNLAGAKLTSAVGDQVMIQWKLEDNLEDMKDELESMAAVLKDAERRSIREESVLLWLKRLKNAAYDISDMLDDFQDGKECRQRTSLLSYVPKNIGLANRMEKMKQQLRKIQEDHERFQFSRDPGGTIEQQITDQRETISAVNEEDVVGREEEKKNIVELLLDRNSKEESIIVPIHGLGGIGKTTLARLVFNDTHFKEYDHRVWVYVSQVLDLKKIGNTIISGVSKQGSHDLNDLESIYQRLKELLNGQKCLIVLDDLWEERETELEKLKTMLNVGKVGSKIDVIVTTRKEEIAQNIRTGKPYYLKPLDDTMCWSIIKKRCNFESRPDKEKLEQIGQDIANKCAGIALAARALGYMLSGMNLEEWSAMRDNYIWSESSAEDTSFPLPSLMLSYKSMPSYLKLCFAYCAIFPKGQDIPKYDLIHQWIALDFIEPSKTFSATQLGEKYVRQLLGMSFLHYSNLPSTSQRLALFTMHDLVHDLATSVMADELLVSDAKKESNSSRNKYCRCAFLTNYSGPTELSAIFPANVRALRFLDCQLQNDAFSFAKYLRVLDLPGCTFSKLPKCVTQLSRLQYLNLQGSDQISALPESIGKIERLMHLDLTGCSRLVELPESLGNLKSLVHFELSGCSSVQGMPKAFSSLAKLQYLNFSWCSNLEKLPEDIGSLTELQYLNLSWCVKLGELPESFQKLHNLVHLDLTLCRGVKGIPGALGGLTKLQYLNLSSSLCSCIGEDWCHLRGLSDVLGSLTELHYLNLSSLCPNFRFLPSDESSVGNLIEHLVLSCNRHLNYLPESLGNLKSLHTLDISYCSGLDSIPESLGNLKTLHTLDISHCSRLDSIPESLGSLKRLHTLHISYCSRLDSIPESLGNLERLHTLDISGCSWLDSIPESIGNLERLHTLDISHCSRLDSIPESLGNLERLHTLHISGCYMLHSIPESIGAIRTLKFIKVMNCSNQLKVHMTHSPLLSKFVQSACFMVSNVNTCSKLHQLEDVNLKELKISCLENVRSLEEARKIKLLERQSLSKLTLEWTSDEDRFLEDKDVLGELVPPRGLQHLELDGYSCISFPTWLMGISHYLPNLIEIKLENLPRCSDLPPLGQLPNLDKLHLKRLKSMTKIGRDFCAREGAFLQLSEFALYDMEQLEEWNTTYCGEDGVEKFMFPKLDKLDIGDCPKLRLTPRPPIFRIWKIKNSDMVISSWSVGDHISHSPSDTPGTTLEVSSSKVPVGEWRLLHHLPTLQELLIKEHDKLTSLPESMRHLVSLRSLKLDACRSISVLPEWMGDLTSLERLIIYRCRSIKSLPQCIQQLTKLKELRIWYNPKLEKWCESDENKMKLAHIENISHRRRMAQQTTS